MSDSEEEITFLYITHNNKLATNPNTKVTCSELNGLLMYDINKTLTKYVLVDELCCELIQCMLLKV